MSPLLPGSHSNASKTPRLPGGCRCYMVSANGFGMEQDMHQESQVSDRLSNIIMESVALETSSNSTYLRHLWLIPLCPCLLLSHLLWLASSPGDFVLLLRRRHLSGTLSSEVNMAKSPASLLRGRGQKGSPRWERWKGRKASTCCQGSLFQDLSSVSKAFPPEALQFCRHYNFPNHSVPFLICTLGATAAPPSPTICRPSHCYSNLHPDPSSDNICSATGTSQPFRV